MLQVKLWWLVYFILFTVFLFHFGFSSSKAHFENTNLVQLCFPENKTSMAASGKNRDHKALRAERGSESHSTNEQTKTSGRESQSLLRGVHFLSQWKDCLLHIFRAQALEWFMSSLHLHDQLSPTVIGAPLLTSKAEGWWCWELNCQGYRTAGASLFAWTRKKALVELRWVSGIIIITTIHWRITIGHILYWVLYTHCLVHSTQWLYGKGTATLI